MFDYIDRLEFILESIALIEERMMTIRTDNDFVASKDGLTILDSVTMRLQAIGENLNKINKDSPQIIEEELQIDVAPIIGFRNIISHHYERLDYQIIFKICTIDIIPLKIKTEAFLNKLREH